MTSLTPLQFGRDLLLAPTGIVPISKEEVRVINTDPYNKKEKGLVSVSTPQEEIMLVHYDLIESQQWTAVTNRKSKGKGKASSCVVCASSREAETDVASITNSKRKKLFSPQNRVPLPWLKPGQVNSSWKSTMKQPSSSKPIKETAKQSMSNLWSSRKSFGTLNFPKRKSGGVVNTLSLRRLSSAGQHPNQNHSMSSWDSPSQQEKLSEKP